MSARARAPFPARLFQKQAELSRERGLNNRRCLARIKSYLNSRPDRKVRYSRKKGGGGDGGTGSGRGGRLGSRHFTSKMDETRRKGEEAVASEGNPGGGEKLNGRGTQGVVTGESPGPGR